MKVCIAGSRDLEPTIAEIATIVDKSKFKITELVSGVARGVDVAGIAWAESENIAVTEFKPKYTTYGRSFAPLMRNMQMAEYCDAAIIIWDGKSSGTSHMMDSLNNFGKNFELVIIK